ncbi:CbiX/SirB N-terminal domain-containing protein [Micromonospora sp. BRA006-A]|nr:CbiX/SirB N-terminal domain-containing protein [Micromonospora sp. BRA006-A]
MPRSSGAVELARPHRSRAGRGAARAGRRRPPRAVLVPLLLTAAYHRKVDIPAAVAAAGADIEVRVTDVLGPTGGGVDGGLLDGLRRRLAEATGDGPDGLDAVVLAAAGTRDPAARASVGRVAAAFGAGLGVPCRVSYASAAPPEVGGAVTRRARRAPAGSRWPPTSWPRAGSTTGYARRPGRRARSPWRIP